MLAPERMLRISYLLMSLQYLIESPSYTTAREWEQFLFRLLAYERLPSSNLQALINVLPVILCQVEVQFSAISQAFNIKTYDSDDEAYHVYVSGAPQRSLY